MYSHNAGGLKPPDDDRDVSTAERIARPRRDHFQFHSARLDWAFYTTVRRRMMMPSKEVVRIEDRQDRWRYVCPRGHRSWEPTNHHFWCQQCAASEDVDGVFHELRDKKTGANLERKQVRLVTPIGPYDRDLDGKEGSA